MSSKINDSTADEFNEAKTVSESSNEGKKSSVKSGETEVRRSPRLSVDNPLPKDQRIDENAPKKKPPSKSNPKSKLSLNRERIFEVGEDNNKSPEDNTKSPTKPAMTKSMAARLTPNKEDINPKDQPSTEEPEPENSTEDEEPKKPTKGKPTKEAKGSRKPQKTEGSEEKENKGKQRGEN